MDRRDQELLAKQLRGVSPPQRNNGVMALTLLAVFSTGVALGGVLFAYQSEPMKIASNDAVPAISNPNSTLPTTRH